MTCSEMQTWKRGTKYHVGRYSGNDPYDYLIGKVCIRTTDLNKL